MRRSDDFLYSKILDRDASYNGRFLVAVTSTMIYCLPSCPALKPKRENVRFFLRESEALDAGFRPCLRCKPDFFYRGEDIDRDTYRAVLATMRESPEGITDATALSRAVAVSTTKLNDLIRCHGQTSPAVLINRFRIQRAMQQLIETNDQVTDIAYAVGFDAESTFHRQFSFQTGLSPGAYRSLRESRFFVLRLPRKYRPMDALAYHGRDAQSKSDCVRANVIRKPLVVDGCPLILQITLDREGAACEVHSTKRLEPRVMVFVHGACLRMLGLTTDPSLFESHVARGSPLASIVAGRRGLRIPLTADAWEALSWGIIGQQINLNFACQLRRELTKIAGTRMDDGMFAHPGPGDVAALDEADLKKRKFSASKARYLIGAARAVMSNDLPVESLNAGSAKVAADTLQSIPGIGIWTANYVMMRGAGFVDCAPAGDSALSTALKRLYDLPERPGVVEAGRLMEEYSPYRSFATAHLWASLRTE